MKKIVLIACILIQTVFAQEAHDIEKLENETTKQSMQKWLDGDFGLEPHKVNYILPYGYREDAYTSSVPSIVYNNIEAELQVSLKLALVKNLFNLNEKYYVAYTQQAFWQLYSDSSPFRESLYNPEAFVEFPIQDEKSCLQLRSFTFGYEHQSNGQPNTSQITFSTRETLENMSRSINYLYTTLRMQHKSLVSDLTFSFPISDLDDNPDIIDYYGYTSLKLSYFFNEHMFTLYTRGNFETLKGAIVGTYSYPLISDTNLYVKVFSGYGESLIDYNNYITKFSIGFSFSR